MHSILGCLFIQSVIICMTVAWPAVTSRSPTDAERPILFHPSDLGFLLYPQTTPIPFHYNDETTNCKCGRVHSSRIVGGSKAISGEWCWQAKIMVWSPENDGSFFLCGGSVINDRYVLSAAHCFYGMENSRVDVYLGAYRLFRDAEGRRYKVSSITIHAGYDPNTKANDIALVELARTIRYSDRICSVCLPTEDNDYTGETATITGWGALKSGGNSPVSLMEAEVKIISNEKCEKEYGYLHPSQMCAAAPGTDSCQGDSGGPLVHKDKDGVWDLIGIVSAGRGCADPNFAGLYTNVYKFLPWIHKITRSSDYCPKN